MARARLRPSGIFREERKNDKTLGTGAASLGIAKSVRNPGMTGAIYSPCVRNSGLPHPGLTVRFNFEWGNTRPFLTLGYQKSPDS